MALCIITIITMMAPTFAQESTPTGVRYQPFIDQNLSEDTIIAYCEGFPILAKDVDESGYFDSSYIPMQRASSSANIRISSGNYSKPIYVEGTLSVPSFSQTEMYTYLPNNRIADLANSLRTNNITLVTQALLGLVKYVGPPASIGFLVNSMIQNNRADDLNNLRVAGNHALYLVIRSPYGVAVTVRQWDGWTIAANSYSTPKSSYVERYNVTLVQYGAKL